jgi:pimeloyl-ACP methyl ester carboxylesterase
MKHRRMTDGTRIAYQVSGPEDAPAIVLCDGIACDGFAWEGLTPRLEGSFRVLHSHHRGHGRSGLPRDGKSVSIPYLARDMVELMDAVGMESATFIGHSMGCQVLLEVAYRYPTRFRAGVLLCGAHGRALDHFQNTDIGFRLLPAIRDLTAKYGKKLAPALRFLVPSRLGYEVAAFSEIDRARTSPRDLSRYLKHLAQMPQESFLATLQDAAERDSEHFLPSIDRPMLIMTGDRDSFTPNHISEPLRELLPEAEFTVIQGGSHIAPIEFPEFILSRVQEFLGTHDLDQVAQDAPMRDSSDWAKVWAEASVDRRSS